MSKELTLDEIWKECLEMWKWISENYEETGENVDRLKLRYMDDNERLGHVPASCFFCLYATLCENCPGALVDPSFKCKNSEYHYQLKPKKFYQELLRLNAIRKEED